MVKIGLEVGGSELEDGEVSNVLNEGAVNVDVGGVWLSSEVGDD